MKGPAVFVLMCVLGLATAPLLEARGQKGSPGSSAVRAGQARRPARAVQGQKGKPASEPAGTRRGAEPPRETHPQTRPPLLAQGAPDVLARNPRLATKIQALLPPGTDVVLASRGFKNTGQFVAAVHVSHNLGISFDDLKARMTGSPEMSLGQAIQALKPDADADVQASRAKRQARETVED